jgi:hypothetical protein
MSEWKNRTLVEATWNMFATAKLPHTFWAEAMLHLATFKTIVTHP